MSGADVLVDLAPGAALVLDGVEWLVERAEPQYGRAVLVSTGGQRLPVTFRFLVNHPGCRPSSRTSAGRAADRDRQPASMADLTARQRELVTLRVAHLLEAETGFRGGDPLRPGPGEPRPGFDPAATTRTQRAVDADRAQRRHRALADRPVVPPPRLGEEFRRRNLFLLPSDDDDGAGQASATDDAEAR